jgi:anti-sigma28 factor (negative regulator of flagellin synthesis)
MQIHGPSQIHGAQRVHGPHTTRSIEPAASPGASGVGDRLDISEAGQIAGRLAEIPEIRAERVQELRAAIAEGAFETEERLSTAVDRLLDEIA